MITFGVCNILVGIVLLITISSYVTNGNAYENISGGVFMIFVTISVFCFIYYGMQHVNFANKYKGTYDFYTEHEKDAFKKKFAIMTAIGVGIIMIGLVVTIITSTLINANNPIPVIIFMSLVTISVGIFTYYGLQQKK